MEIILLAIICYFGAKLLFPENKPEPRKNVTSKKNITPDEEAFMLHQMAASGKRDAANDHSFAKGVGTGMLTYMAADALLDKHHHEDHDGSSVSSNDDFVYLDDDPTDCDMDDSFDDFDGFDDF